VVPNITIHPISLTYSGLWRMTSAELGFYLSYAQNVPNFPSSNDASDAQFNATRLGSHPNYRLYRVGMNYSRVVAEEWQLRAVFSGQYTNDMLVPGEQFGYGGPDSVRGFNNREVSNDRGYSANFEVYTPELGSKFDWRWKDLKARLLAFYDVGYTDRVTPSPGDPIGEFGSSVGIGLRLAAGKSLSLRADLAEVINAAGLQNKRDKMIHASMAIVF
jgi:hemolysin activation/secretion protein